MKKRILSMVLAVVMTVILVPVVHSTAAGPKRITEGEIKVKFDQYVSELGIGTGYKFYWNAGLRDKSDDSRLKDALDRYAQSGNKADLLVGLNTSGCCKGRYVNEDNNTHLNGVKVSGVPGCTSNCFDGTAQCFGFARYFMYYLFGQKEKNSGHFYEYKNKNVNSWESIGGLQIGDHVRVKGHSFVYYSGAGDEEIMAIQINGHSSSKPCSLNFERVYKNNKAYYTANDLKTLYNSGKVTIRRYKYIDHEYKFNNDNSVTCTFCGKAYSVPTPTGGGKYMDIVAVNGSNTAPAHTTPYGAATITARYKKGQTVYVTGSSKNAFGNTWYRLSSGDWLTGDYLGDHMHCWAGGGFCTRCLSASDTGYYSPIWMGTVRLTTTTAPIHFAPYGDSLVYATCYGGATVDAKVINGYGREWFRIANGKYKGGWIYAGNMNTSSLEFKLDEPVALRYGPGTAYKTVTETLSAKTTIRVYPIEVSEENSNWYSARYGDIVGFIPKDSGDFVGGTRYVEPPDAEPPRDSVEGTGDAPSSGGGSSGISSVSVQYPTDSNYLSKFAVSDTGAVVVANILKPEGTRVTACGLLLYNSSGELLKDHREAVSNVGNSTTSFHAWFDIEKDLGLTLTPGTRYLYALYAVVDGVVYEEGRLSFTTTGTAPAATPDQVYVFYPSDPDYLNKFVVSDNNATVVANVLKPAGTKVTACGLRLYDANGALLKDHRQAVSNVGDAVTSFHVWYDIESEVGLTLTPGTYYCYQIYAVVDGVVYEEGMYSFTTTGTAPVTPPPTQDTSKYNLIFDANGGTCDTTSKAVTYNTPVGTLPTAARTGYTFAGWFTKAEDGNLINSQTNYNAVYDVTVFAHWDPNTYHLIFNANGGSCTIQSKAVIFDTLIGDMPVPVRSGYTFDGWYTLAQDGKEVHDKMRYNTPYDVTVYAHWSEGTAVDAMKDVSSNAWYFNAVNYVVSNGLMGGYNATTFGPNDSLNRAMMLQIIYNKEGKPAVSGKHGFTDAPATQWYNNAITWGTKKGIMGGYGGGKFGPDDAVTLEQIAVILWNYAGNPAFTGNANNAGPHSAWASNALGWATEIGLLDGLTYSAVTHKATRAQAAHMLMNYLEQ